MTICRIRMRGISAVAKRVGAVHRLSWQWRRALSCAGEPPREGTHIDRGLHSVGPAAVRADATMLVGENWSAGMSLGSGEFLHIRCLHPWYIRVHVHPQRFAGQNPPTTSCIPTGFQYDIDSLRRYTDVWSGARHVGYQ
jgi:hypothetical protein